jgi:AcrR family transcriptional regulator
VAAKPAKTTRRTQAERSEATRAALISAARPLFAARGYADVGAEEIVRAAGVTRGALYHHFDGKEGLLEAVYREIEAEITQEIGDAVLSGGAEDPLAALRIGVQKFLETTMEPEAQRIVLLDAPAVLGWEKWREIGYEHGLGLTEAVLTAAMEAGVLQDAPVRPLAHILLGALDEAAMLIARAEDQETGRQEALLIFDRLLEGLRAG